MALSNNRCVSCQLEALGRRHIHFQATGAFPINSKRLDDGIFTSKLPTRFLSTRSAWTTAYSLPSYRCVSYQLEALGRRHIHFQATGAFPINSKRLDDGVFTSKLPVRFLSTRSAWTTAYSLPSYRCVSYQLEALGRRHIHFQATGAFPINSKRLDDGIFTSKLPVRFLSTRSAWTTAYSLPSYRRVSYQLEALGRRHIHFQATGAFPINSKRLDDGIFTSKLPARFLSTRSAWTTAYSLPSYRRVSYQLEALGRRHIHFQATGAFPINSKRLDDGIFTSKLPVRFLSTRSAWTTAYSLPRYWWQNAGVEHALLEQLTLFPNASIVLQDVDTHRSTLRRHVKTQTKCRQSHVNAGTVRETKKKQEHKVDLWPALGLGSGSYNSCNLNFPVELPQPCHCDRLNVFRDENYSNFDPCQMNL